jgi:hypothetical protein
MVKRRRTEPPSRKAKKQKRPRGTKFINYTCKLDKDNCIHNKKGLCIHNTPTGNSKVGCLVNAEDAQLSCGNGKTVEFKCDVCLHVFSPLLNNVNNGKWCSMCSRQWKHCGDDTCTFCFDRSFASYKGVTLNNKKKVDCIVNRADLRLPLGTTKTVEFNCDVCLHVFSTSLNSVTTNGQWCGKCRNKTELMVLNYLQEMKIEVDTQYIPGGKKMKQNYGKIGKMDYYLPTFNILWELDGAQHNTQVMHFGGTLFHRMILDKWKEFWARECGMNVIRFDQEAIWNKKYDWKQEMKNILTLTSPEQLRRQLELTKKRYKNYAKEHNDNSKHRDIPEIVKVSHLEANTASSKSLNSI